MNVYSYLFEAVNADAVALQSSKETMSYGALLALTNRVAATLLEAGVEPGTRVGIIAQNAPFWVASYLAILKLGAVAVPSSWRFSPMNFHERQILTQARFFCVDARLLKKFEAAMPADTTIITEAARLPQTPLRVLPVAAAAADIPTAEVGGEALAALMFTSGSTGTPNAVKVTHRNIIANSDSIIEYLGLTADERMMVVMPFDYCFAASLLHTHLRVGARLVLNNLFTFTEEVLNNIETFECTGFAGVPAIFQHLLERSTLTERTLPSLRHIQQAGGKLHTHFIERYVRHLPHVRFFVMYGQTEATARLSYLPPERLSDKLGSIGRGIPGVTLEVLNDAGQPVQPGEEGEIVATGDNVVAGYLVPDPERDSFRNGKLYTGDLAKVDEEGFIYVVGRKKDFIKPFGHRVGCAEIEGVIMAMAGVVDAAVIGVPDNEAGEIAQAFVALKPGHALTAEQIQQHCRQSLPYYAIPRTVVFMPELPKNEAGKTIKRDLKTLAGVE